MWSIAQATEKSPAATIVPYAGWALAAVLGIWIAKQFFGRMLQDLASQTSALFIKHFGRRALSRRALVKYRKAVLTNYGQHPLGFRREGTVNVNQVYVPLQYVDEQGHRADLDDVIHSADRTVIVGEPGAGKSLLLKHLLIQWATGVEPASQKIPVLVELHRCNETDVSLEGLVAEEFWRNGVRGREGVVERALTDGQLLVLLDGLDEVTRDNQTRVVRQVKDFAARWGNCRHLATCRVAVYTGQLSPQFPSVVGITDFDDAGIRRLLANWPGLGADEADRLFAGLSESPQLMRLAGSPLLLTMMVYLQAEVFAKSGRTLPSSRPAFYDVAVDHLLRRDRELARDDSLSAYEGADKRAALQRVALTLQRTPPGQPDRRSMDRGALIDAVKQVATRLNLREEDVTPLIKEIVERSQLLVELGSHTGRYAFRHLTLQEFLSASELRNDPTTLMDSYRADPDGWRETVRLWCGVTSLDCTGIVETVFNSDDQAKILALQCVAEATNIEPDLARRVVGHFVDLVAADQANPQIESALGAVASDERPRARMVFRQLEELFLSAGAGQGSAARALAATRLPAAAQILGRRMLDDESARNALRTMGEQAVSVFRAAAAGGDCRSVDDLGEIATAAAATALASIIWDDSDAAFRAAWWIAALNRRPEVESSLLGTNGPLKPGVQALDWVWRPVSKSGTWINACMGRVAWLIAHDVEDHAPARFIDRRIAVPLIALGPEHLDGEAPGGASLVSILDEEARVKQAVVDLMKSAGGSAYYSGYRAADLIADVSGRHPDLAKSAIELLLSGLPQQKQRIFTHASPEVQYAMIADDMPLESRRRGMKQDQWVEASSRVVLSRSLVVGRNLIMVLLLASVLAAAAYRVLGPPILGVAVVGPAWTHLPVAIAFAVAVLSLVVWFFSEVVFTSTIAVVDWLVDLSDDVLDSSFGLIVLGAGWLISAAAAVSLLAEWSGWVIAVAVTCLALMALVWIEWIIESRRKRIRNVFRKYVQGSESALVSSWRGSAITDWMTPLAAFRE